VKNIKRIVNNSFYLISKEENAVIYGAGALGRQLYLVINKLCPVIAFFDQNATKVRKRLTTIPILTAEEGIKKYGNDLIVFVCIHNAEVHWEVAEKLYSFGVDKIIFLPVGNTYDNGMALRMLSVYSCLFEDNCAGIGNIPFYSVIRKCPWQEEIIRETANFVVTWCSIEILYTYKEATQFEKEEKIELPDIANLPVPAMREMLDGYRYFSKGEGNIKEYISTYMRIEGSFNKECSFLKRRFSTFQMLETEWKNNQEYFKFAPIDVSWNEKGYFNIIDGHNRAAFFYLKGVNWVPVRMKREDYYSWRNQDMARKVIDELIQINEVEFSTPVPHPFFKNINSKKENNGIEVLGIIQEFLGREIRTVKSIVEISNYEGYFARNFIRTGANKVFVIEESETIKNKIILINQLMQIKSINVVNVIKKDDLESEFDAVFLFDKWSEKEINESDFTALFKNSRYLFWESKNDPLREKDAIYHQGNYDSYFKLMNKCYGNKVSEIGVFYNRVNK